MKEKEYDKFADIYKKAKSLIYLKHCAFCKNLKNFYAENAIEIKNSYTKKSYTPTEQNLHTDNCSGSWNVTEFDPDWYDEKNDELTETWHNRWDISLKFNFKKVPLHKNYDGELVKVNTNVSCLKLYKEIEKTTINFFRRKKILEKIKKTEETINIFIKLIFEDCLINLNPEIEEKIITKIFTTHIKNMIKELNKIIITDSKNNKNNKEIT